MNLDEKIELLTILYEKRKKCPQDVLQKLYIEFNFGNYLPDTELIKILNILLEQREMLKKKEQLDKEMYQSMEKYRKVLNERLRSKND